MRKIIISTLCIALAAVFLTGCVTINFSPSVASAITGRGNVETFTFDVGEITEVRVELLCNIVYHSAPSNTVTFSVQPNLMDYISIEESGGILTVRSTRNINWSSNTNTPTLVVSTPSLTRVSHTGAGNFSTVDPITADSFDLNITGAANSNVALDVRNLSVTVAGAGNLELSGTADQADISLTGASRLEALDLQTRIASITMAGAGTARISCSDELSISAGGVGTVEYRGSPTIDMIRGGLVTVMQVS